ncbi:MAG: ATP-binding protein [Candidatus Cloacimonetes bacterium]|nr:ATP-binding protein [Candidatus Cloacimonadota bacterium]
MRLKFSNIGIIKEADILIDGLTVIAGVNDTGKSTIGKLLYFLIKIVNNYKEQFRNNQANRLFSLIDDIKDKGEENIYHESIKRDNKTLSDQSKLLNERNKLRFLLRKFEQEVRNKVVDIIENSDDIEKDVLKVIDEFIENIDIDLGEITYNKIKEEIGIITKLNENSESVKKAAIDIMIQNEFDRQITSSLCKKKTEIVLDDNNMNIARMILNCNEIEEISNMVSSTYSDITYIDIPFSFGDDNINRRFLLRKGKYLINHIKDLQWKLYVKYLNSDDENDIIDEIEKREMIDKFKIFIKQVIGGDFGFKEEERNFIFRKNGDEFRIKNIAEGIKAFAIIKILLESRFIQKNSILIIDEPEVHLHPQWQINYAELLVRMVKELKIKVLINSHSTYMIEAFKIYSDHYGISETTNFYLMKKRNKYSESKLVNDQLNTIYEELSKPYSKLDEVLLNDFDK